MQLSFRLLAGEQGDDLSVIPVNRLPDGLAVRRLRNQCREFMTRHRGEISILQQIRWFYRSYRPDLDRGSFQIFLWRDAAGSAIAYGALRLEQEEFWITECVGEKWRGRGIGTKILAHLQEVAGLQGRGLVAEIRADNEPSLRLHRRLGFSSSGDEHDGLCLLRWSPHPVEESEGYVRSSAHQHTT